MQAITAHQVEHLEARRLSLITEIRGMARSQCVEPAPAKLVGIRDMQHELNALNKQLGR